MLSDITDLGKKFVQIEEDLKDYQVVDGLVIKDVVTDNDLTTITINSLNQFKFSLKEGTNNVPYQLTQIQNENDTYSFIIIYPKSDDVTFSVTEAGRY